MSGYGGLNRVDRSKDNSGFSPQQRHDVIMAKLSEFGKGPQAFQLRWRENSGELLTGETLLKTPMFWFMKYKWSRSEIEALFFAARVEIDSKFDMALQQTFGGDPGPRWKGGGGVKKKAYRRAADVTDERGWREDEEKKGPREPDSVHGPRRDPNFEYNPVIQPVDFQATGGVDRKTKDPTSKEYGRGPWERLPPKDTTDPHGSGPKMGKGKIPSDPSGPDGVALKPIPDYSKWKEPTGDAVFVINIECPDGKVLELRCEKEDPLHYVKKQIVEKTGGKYPETKQILRFQGNELLNDDASLESYGIRNGDTLQLSVGPITVYVEKKSGQRIELKVDPHDTIAAVKKGVEAKTNPSIPAQEQKLYKTKQRAKVAENELDDNYRSLFNYGIADGDVMYLGGPSVWRPPTDDNGYPIFVECPDGKTLTLNVTADDDIAYTKLQIEQITRNKYPISEQLLYFKRKELSDDDATLRDENIVKNSVLQLSLGKIPIFVETREGKVLSLMVDPHETVLNVKKEVESMTSDDPERYPVAEQQLFNRANDEELTDNARTISKYGIGANSYLYLGGTIPVRIRKPDGSITRLDIDPNDPTKVMKELMNKRENIPINQQTLYFNNVELNDARPSKHYGIQRNDVIDLKLTFPIFVEKPDKSRIKLDVSPQDSVLSIKERVENKTHPAIPVAAQTLTFKKQVLEEDAAPISKYAIVENSVIYLSCDEDDPQALLEKILSRDAPPAERLDALNKIHKNLNVEKKKKYCDVLLKKDQIPLLICGHGVQILDEEPVRRTAIENVPDIMKQAMDENEEAVVASGALDETLDSLFKIYDDPRCRKIHPYAQKAINRIVEDVISRQNPQSINKLVEKLGEKVDLENISTPAVRQFAMQNLQKTMFPKENRLLRKIFSDGAALKKLPDDAPKESDLAPKGSAERLWFDTVVDDTVNPANNRVIGDKHRDDLWKSINEMITDPNPDNKQIGLNLAALFCKKNDQLFKQRLDGHARPIYQKWKFGPQKPYDLKMPPKAPKKKYKVDPLEPVDYRIKQQTGLQIGGMTEMPDL